MAYVRKVRTTSGAVAVQVAHKDNGRVVVLAHLGSAHTDAELGILLARADEVVAGGQQTLDFEVNARAQSLTDVADYRESALLKASTAGPAVVAPPGRTTGTSSRLLYGVLGSVYDWLGFGVIDDPVFRDLVIARIVEPTSKLDSARVLADLGVKTVSYRSIQRHLVKTVKDRYRDKVAAKCFAYASDCGGLSLILYDATTLYFEAEHEDDLRKIGYSKERRVDPQIVVGLLVDRTGFPLEISCHEGNTAETTTIVPIITSFVQRHSLEGTPVVVAADAGMLSAANLKALDELGCSFIVGSRTTKAPGDLESHFHWNGDVFTDGQIVDTVTPRHGNTTVNDPALRAETGLGPRPAPQGVAGDLVVFGQKGPPRPEDPGRPGRTRPCHRRRRTLRQVGTVRQSQRIRPPPRRNRPGAGPIAGRPQRLRQQHARHRDGGHRGDRQVPRPVESGEVVPDVQV